MPLVCWRSPEPHRSPSVPGVEQWGREATLLSSAGPHPGHKGSDEAEGLPCLWDLELSPRLPGGNLKTPLVVVL